MPTGRQHSGAILLCLSVCLCVLDRPRETHGQQSVGHCLGTEETSELARQFREQIKVKSQTYEFDSTLYTPTLLNYHKCPSSTISCFAAEAKVLRWEWTSYTSPPVPRAPHRTTHYRLARNLAILEKMVNETVEAGCPQCEFYVKRSAEMFLDALLDVLYSINSQKCRR